MFALSAGILQLPFRSIPKSLPQNYSRNIKRKQFSETLLGNGCGIKLWKHAGRQTPSLAEPQTVVDRKRVLFGFRCRFVAHNCQYRDRPGRREAIAAAIRRI